MINRLENQYRFLSNFWSCFICFEEGVYPSVENAYQAAKCYRLEDRSQFYHCKASEAKKLGKIVKMRGDWNDIRVNVMYELVKQKFKDMPLSWMLLDTAPHIIEEGNWWGDTFWGTCNGVGENHLGKILMRVRDELNAKPNNFNL